MPDQQTSPTPAEHEIAAIVAELWNDGFIDIDQADIIALEAGDDKRAADLFVLWALGLCRRVLDERAERDGERAASIEARERLLGWHTTTAGEVPDDD